MQTTQMRTSAASAIAASPGRVADASAIASRRESASASGMRERCVRLHDSPTTSSASATAASSGQPASEAAASGAVRGSSSIGSATSIASSTGRPVRHTSIVMPAA